MPGSRATSGSLVRLPKNELTGDFSKNELERLLASATIKPALHQLERHPYLPQNEFMAFHKKVPPTPVARGLTLDRDARHGLLAAREHEPVIRGAEHAAADPGKRRGQARCKEVCGHACECPHQPPALGES